MCGILGFVGGEKNSDTSVSDALERLAHRGPDARGSYQGDGIVLGHLRLSILDLSSLANQPMHSHCGRYVMVFNGEIYNFKAIHQRIASARPGFVSRTQSDSEIILEAFAIWNTHFLQFLNGMFAMAIWDKQERKLFLFRDRLGIKPLYFFEHDHVFAFASELKVLAKDPGIRKHLTHNSGSINQFLHLGYIPSPRSIYTQISKFPAGHFGVVQGGQLSLHQYWNLEEKITRGIYPTRSYSDYLEELQELVESSVKYRLVSDVPYGTFLSGGVDSSLVTAVAQSLHSKPINSFSIGFWDKEFDESMHARNIAQYLGTSHHSMMVTEEDALEWMPELTDIYDEPYADSSAIPTLMVSQMARRHVTMTLSGDGGDELFMGYGAYRWARRLSHPVVSLLRAPASILLKHGPMKYRRAAGLFDKVSAEQQRSHIFSQEQYLFSRKEIRSFLRKDYYQEFLLKEHSKSSLTASEQQALFDINYYLPDDLLVKVDRASMFFGLETRVPLLDYRLVEWAVNLPVQHKWHKGEAKWLLKQLLYKYVPAEFFNRPKRGFAIPLKKWLKSELKDFAMDYLNEQAIRDVGVLEPAMVRDLLDGFYRKDQFYLYNKVWQLLVLQKWLMQNKG